MPIGSWNMAPSADWDEIKRLAADFQKAQLSSTVQRYVSDIHLSLLL